MNLKEKKKEFLLEVFFSNSVAGASQRNHIYEKKEEEMSLSEKRLKVKMKEYLFTELKKLPSFLRADITGYIDTLRSDIVKDYKNILRNRHMTFGTVQKVVNLYLKYLWVAGYLGEKEPPHCPIDRIILSKIGWMSVSWTKMERGDYQEAICKITEQAKKQEKSIAEWELEYWSDAK